MLGIHDDDDDGNRSTSHHHLLREQGRQGVDTGFHNLRLSSERNVETYYRSRRTTYPQALKEYIDQLNHDSMMMMVMSKTSLALGGQAVAAVAANALTNGTSSSSSAVFLVEFATLLGLSLTFASLSLRVKRRASSNFMARVGAISTASAIIISLGSHLPPEIAWTVGSLAVLIVAAAVASA